MRSEIELQLEYNLNRIPNIHAERKLSALYSILDDEEKRELNDMFCDVYHFFIDEITHIPLKKKFSYAYKQKYRLDDKVKFFEDNGGDLIGKILSDNENGTGSGVVFLNDVSEPGRVRYSEFDRSGFFSHSTFDTFSDALDGSWSNGYRYIQSQTWFLRLTNTPHWQKGMDRTNEIMKINLNTYRQHKIENIDPISCNTEFIRNRTKR